MNSTQRNANVLTLSFLSLIFFVFVAYIFGIHRSTKFDNAVISIIQGLESPLLTLIMKFFTFIGSTKVVVFLALCSIFFLYKVLHHRLELILFVVILGGNGILNYILKVSFHKPRPSLHRLIQETGYSFPSGHSMSAFALYATLAFLLWKHIPTWTGRSWTISLCIIMILMIGISRIYLGVHYPSDVIGAYFASGFWFALSVWLFQWYKEFSSSEKNSYQSPKQQ
jgi:undecaprenyl-diphosphatase